MRRVRDVCGRVDATDPLDAMALVDSIEHFPADHPGRETLTAILQRLVDALLPMVAVLLAFIVGAVILLLLPWSSTAFFCHRKIPAHE